MTSTRIAQDSVQFLRGSFFRWAQLFPAVSPIWLQPSKFSPLEIFISLTSVMGRCFPSAVVFGRLAASNTRVMFSTVHTLLPDCLALTLPLAQEFAKPLFQPIEPDKPYSAADLRIPGADEGGYLPPVTKLDALLDHWIQYGGDSEIGPKARQGSSRLVVDFNGSHYFKNARDMDCCS